MSKSMKFQTPSGEIKYYVPNGGAGGAVSARTIPMIIKYLRSHEEWLLLEEGSCVQSLFRAYPDHFQMSHLKGLIYGRLALSTIEINLKLRSKE